MGACGGLEWAPVGEGAALLVSSYTAPSATVRKPDGVLLAVGIFVFEAPHAS